MSCDDSGTIGRIFHTEGTVRRLEDGCVLIFEQPIPAVEDDMIVVKLASGEERTLHVEQVHGDTLTVSLMKGSFNTIFALERVDRGSLKVVLQPHHRAMPEAF